MITENYGSSWWFRRHQKMRNAPHIIGFIRTKHFCAYKSIKEMKKWLTASEIKRFIKKGFIVLELDVTDYIIDTDQVLYTKASITSKKDISNLFI